ncbi:PREDICTED: zinc finger protein 469 [Condylura cristata]|uniref:zinc finger protein 469 n=1 Tax=Condylura cristata TaxID=143302 RepID=UPI000642D0A5|nr:PREDICTED: zinc finger protein 469 [Condylura cristata]
MRSDSDIIPCDVSTREDSPCHVNPMTSAPVASFPALPPPPLSPLPSAPAEASGSHQPDLALDSSGREVLPGSARPAVQQACARDPRARGQGAEGRRAAGPPHERHGPPAAAGSGAPGHCPDAPSQLQKEKEVPKGHAGGPSGKSSAARPGGCQSLPKDTAAPPLPSQAPVSPETPRKAGASPAPTEPAPGTEGRVRPATLKAKPGPHSQGGGDPGRGAKTAGGSQPQPASGQLQSETACTPARPGCPGQTLAPDKPGPRATAKGCPKGPKEAGDQGPQGSLGPREDGEGTARKRKNRAPRPTRSRGGGAVPEKPPRAPRKQAAPSRVLPTKPRSSSKTPLQPLAPRKGEPTPAHRDARPGGLGQALPQARPLHGSPKRSRVVLSAGLAAPHACRTAESQSTLLSQLFGQRLTGFKIPLKKGSAQ